MIGLLSVCFYIFWCVIKIKIRIASGNCLFIMHLLLIFSQCKEWGFLLLEMFGPTLGTGDNMATLQLSMFQCCFAITGH